MTDNAYDTMRAAMEVAETQMSAADSVAKTLADMLRGRLRKVSDQYGSGILCDLKRELRDFDMVTRRWKR
jgi:hypothetical protein